MAAMTEKQVKAVIEVVDDMLEIDRRIEKLEHERVSLLADARMRGASFNAISKQCGKERNYFTRNYANKVQEELDRRVEEKQ